MVGVARFAEHGCCIYNCQTHAQGRVWLADWGPGVKKRTDWTNEGTPPHVPLVVCTPEHEEANGSGQR